MGFSKHTYFQTYMYMYIHVHVDVDAIFYDALEEIILYSKQERYCIANKHYHGF